MKHFLLFFFFIFFVFSCSTSSKKTVFSLTDNKVVVKICVNTSREELEEIKSVLKSEKNIDFDYSKTTFSSDGQIDLLDFIVKGPEGYQGHVQTELYMTDEYHGFIRDYNKGAEKPFSCGGI